ncbi:hypothetical protein CASFOL_027840 [Castilleja foliolosa]|uniref:F-box domain-containing protein n=1 Tax=Castilleja foliolosa TaxID=1961234 RepID=A0ABD3CHN8_9LAMI
MKAQKRSKSSSTNPFSLFLIFSLRLWHNMNRERRVKRKSKKVKIQLHNISPIAISNCIFPIDVMLCILTRLPVKSIIRFKSVCKPWFALLSSPDFKKLHQVQFSNDPRNQTYLFQHSNNTLSLFQIGSNQKKPTFLNHPFSHNKINIDVVGCFNGFVCLSEKPFNDVIYLWNPALNMSKRIFPLEECEECGLHEWVSLGFGYDAESDDLKVVKIVCVESRTHLAGMSAIRVEVYSVNSDSWISIIDWDMPFSILRTINDLHVNGMPYWVGSVYYMPVLVYLDLKNMILKYIPLMQLITGEEMLRQIYFDYNGCIAALMFHIDNERIIRSVIEVWVYDADDNYWTKHRTLAPTEVSLYHIYMWTKNKKFIGKSPDGKLFVCDPGTGCVEESIYFGQQRDCICMYEYTENINRIYGMKRVKVKKRTKKMIVDAAGGN